MFRQLDVPLLGVIENMSFYICPHCGQPDHIFGDGGGQRISEKLGTTLLARVPLDRAVRVSGDSGLPVVLAAPDSPSGKALREAVETILAKAQAGPSRPTPMRFTPDPDLRIIS
jgi:ATP-binding protein involved in chromosome partitioning